MNALHVALAAVLLAAPAFASEPAVLGTIPPYPGATRPLKHWESKASAIALTKDKPPAVVAYYIDRLVESGWLPEAGIAAEATASAQAGEPAWLTFTRSGVGRLDLQVTRGVHPKTGEAVTLIFYQSQLKL